MLQPYLTEDPNILEIGVDEVGRGPLFGAVYTAAVVLPKEDSFAHHLMKDSKKFHSKKKINEVAEYIKMNAIAYSVDFESEKVIDEINILQATQKSMHKSILSVKKQLKDLNIIDDETPLHLLIDGNYFEPVTVFNKKHNKIEHIPYTTVEQGDSKFTSIAAASILAKVARDQYIEDLCLANPDLSANYGIDSNKGYGAKKHMDGIKTHGITNWHRRSFKPCSSYI
jgi:ribonuclease HII